MSNLCISCIYKITNRENGKFYIGSAQCFVRRKANHKSDLRKNKHANIYLQRAWNKYGDCFDFEILARCPISYLLKLEKWFIKSLNPQYNLKLNVERKTQYDIDNNQTNNSIIFRGYNSLNNTGVRLTNIKVVNIKPRKPDPRYKIVYEFSKDGKLIKIWPSVREISKHYRVTTNRIVGNIHRNLLLRKSNTLFKYEKVDHIYPYF